MAEDHEDPQRGRLAAWPDSQGVDLRAKLVFLSLPSDAREAVRHLGQLKTSRNPSATLMARIRQLYPSFVELDGQAQEQWTREAAARMPNYRVELASSVVWLVVRGESNPVGSGNQIV